MVPGPYNQCNVKLEFKPTADAAFPIMSAINSLVPAGRTPLTQGIETAAEALDFRYKPGVIVVLTDGEETCGRSPCELAKQLHAAGYKLTVHVIAFRYEGFSWTGSGSSVMDLMCVAKENNGLYLKANTRKSWWRRWRKRSTARWSRRRITLRDSAKARATTMR